MSDSPPPRRGGIAKGYKYPPGWVSKRKGKPNTWCLPAASPTEFTELQRQVFDGSMLGDGHLMPATIRSRYRVLRKKTDIEYMEWTLDIFKDFFTTGVKCRDVFDVRTGKTYSNCYIQSVKSDLLTHERLRWYPDGKKIVPRDLIVSPMCVAVWFCDDGSFMLSGLKSGSRRAKFSTDGFTFDDAGFLADQLSSRYSEPFAVCKNGGNPIIVASTNATEVMFGEIGHLIPDCMPRKKLFENAEAEMRHLRSRRLHGVNWKSIAIRREPV